MAEKLFRCIISSTILNGGCLDAQVIVGTLAVCRKTRLSEEVLAEAVERHFKSFHQVPHGIAEEVFHKWASKMASAIVRMSVRFKHLHTVPKTSKSKTLSKMKLDLDTRLAVQSLSASKEDNTDSILEADPLPIVEEQDVRLEALGTLLSVRRESTPLRAARAQVLRLLKVLDPILWSTLHFSTPLRPNHRRHTFTTAATVCLGCGLSLNVHSETYQRIGL